MSKEIQVEDLPSIAAGLAFAESQQSSWTWDSDTDPTEVLNIQQEIGAAVVRRAHLYERLETTIHTIEKNRRPLRVAMLDGRPGIALSPAPYPQPIYYSIPRVTEAVGFMAYIGISNGYITLLERRGQNPLKGVKSHAPLFNPTTFELTASLSFA